uniref:Uncharacterized protein n=1 Tax=Rhizophora mucronata TaxID=61149 RepID=A0A2P2NCF8_RHIMU
MMIGEAPHLEEYI